MLVADSLPSTAALRPRGVPAGEGGMLWMVGDLVTLKMVREDTGGVFTFMEQVTPPQGGPPPHMHTREDETFYVLEGEFEFVVGGRTLTATAGSVVYGPRNLSHVFKNVGSAPGRLAVFITPGGLEKFFEEVGEPAVDPSSPPPGTPEDIEKVVAVAPKYGVAIPPPPENRAAPKRRRRPETGVVSGPTTGPGPKSGGKYSTSYGVPARLTVWHNLFAVAARGRGRTFDPLSHVNQQTRF